MAGVYQGDAHNKIAELRSILPRQIAAFRHNLAMAEQLNAVGVAASANRGIEAYIKRLELIR